MGIIERKLTEIKDDKRAAAARRPESINRAKREKPEEIDRSRLIDVALSNHETPDPKILERNRVLAPSMSRHPAQAAYRMLRTRLIRRIRSNGWKVLGVTAAGPNEGKTLTAINLAISIVGEPDQQVVLADFDLRRPTIHKYLGIEPRATVVDYLQTSDANVNDYLVCPDVERLGVALNNESVDNSSDLLSTARTHEFLDDISDNFSNTLTILDLPPLLSADDALVIAPLVDAYLFVVAEGQTTRDDMERAKELLKELNVVGTVLNKSVSSDASRYYYY